MAVANELEHLEHSVDLPVAVCAIGKVDDGTLRVCCSTHQHVLCGHHYARSHFVEVGPEWNARPCNAHIDGREDS